MKVKSSKDADAVMKVPEVAAMLRVSPGFVYHLIRTGKLPVLDLGGARRVPRAAFERMLEMRREAAQR